MRSREELVAQSWGIAFGHYLSGYPEELAPEEVLELIAQEDDCISYWEPFEGFAWEWMDEHIQTMQVYMLGELLWAQGVDA